MNFNKFSRIALAVAFATAMGSCGIYTSYKTPESTPMTKAYAEARELPVDSAAFGNLLWEDVFTDPILAGYIREALQNNVNLQNAKLNVDVANANLLGANLSYLPSVALAPTAAIAGNSYIDGTSKTYQIPASVSWEIDIFGKLRNNRKGAKAAVLKSEAYAQAVRSQIIGAVANTYYALTAVKTQLELQRNTAGLWKQTVKTMSDLKEGGRGVTEAAVVQSAANYYSILSSITDLEASVDQLNNTMSLLLNKLPQEWETTRAVDLQVPTILRAGVPMAELAARPDVRAAEQDLAAAFYATNSARAAFYPSLNITANGGFTNSLGTLIVNPGQWFYQLAGSLTAPLFSRGQNIARLKASKIQQQQTLNNFEYTILSAAAEVSDALTVYEKSIEKSAHLKQMVENLEKSVEYTNDLMLYSTGSTSYLEVLTAQQSLLGAQMNQISTDLSRAQAVINLYQALGGGR